MHVPRQRIEAVRGPLTGTDGPLPVDLPSSGELKLPEATEDSEWGYGFDAESLLTANGRVLAARLTRNHWHDSQIIVVADGSWLLNLPLVDHANRRLAAALIDECGPPGRVCFLESDASGLRITDSDAELPLVLQMFTVWPVNLFMLHLVLVGLIYCFYVWPIFGRPQRLPDDRVSDFGKHITAVGELLERGQDYAYAKSQIEEYQRKYDES